MLADQPQRGSKNEGFYRNPQGVSLQEISSPAVQNVRNSGLKNEIMKQLTKVQLVYLTQVFLSE